MSWNHDLRKWELCWSFTAPKMMYGLAKSSHQSESGDVGAGSRRVAYVDALDVRVQQ